MGDNVTFINMGKSAAKAVKKLLEENDGLCDASNISKRSYYVSDKTASFKKTATVLLGEEFCEDDVEQVDINLLSTVILLKLRERRG